MITLLNKFDDKYIIQKDDIHEITSKYIKENEAQEFLRDVNLTKESDIVVDFNYKNNELSINMDKLLEQCYKLYRELKERYKIEDQFESYFINYYILEALYQELVHVSQKKRLNSNEEELYKHLIELSIKIKENNPDFHKDNKLIIPGEIEARNTGILTAYNWLDYTKLPVKKDQILYLEYLRNLLLNYKKKNKYQVETPIELLIQKDSSIDIEEIYKLVDKSKMKKIGRLNLGLPITAREYSGVEKAIKNRS